MFTVYWGGTVINAGPSPSSGNRQHPDNIPFLPPPVAWCLGWAGLGGGRRWSKVRGVKATTVLQLHSQLLLTTHPQ